MKVLDSKVLLQVQKSGTATEKINGFEVPIGAGEFEVAKVIAVGPSVKDVAPEDTVYIYTGSGKEFTHDGQKYRVVTSSEIIVVL